MLQRGPLVKPNLFWLWELAISLDGKLLAGWIAPEALSGTSENCWIVLWDISQLHVAPRQHEGTPGTTSAPLHRLP
jgi:hypothetical protein